MGDYYQLESLRPQLFPLVLHCSSDPFMHTYLYHARPSVCKFKDRFSFPRKKRAREEKGKRRERPIDDDSHEQLYFGSRYWGCRELSLSGLLLLTCLVDVGEREGAYVHKHRHWTRRHVTLQTAHGRAACTNTSQDRGREEKHNHRAKKIRDKEGCC